MLKVYIKYQQLRAADKGTIEVLIMEQYTVKEIIEKYGVSNEWERIAMTFPDGRIFLLFL